MQLLKQYRAWQNEERLRLGAYYNYQGFVFTQDNGNPIHPYSFSTWFDRFAKRHDLPRLNPHCFRHSMASMLIYAGVDSVSVSKRLGHSQVSTTMNIYSHVMEEADKRNADVIGDILLKSKAQ
jgi:integrase